MVLAFNELDLLSFKEKNPDIVILIADETKNPGVFMGSWDKIKPQTPNEINDLLDSARLSNKKLTNWGIRVGTNEYWGGDFEWSWVYRIWMDKLGSRSETYTIQTANGGKRPVYLTNEVNKDWGEPYKNNIRFEIKNKGYVILGGMAIDILNQPSEYKVIKDVPIKRDDQIIQDTINILETILAKASFLEYNCIKTTLDKKMRMDHDRRLAILTFMLLESWPDEAIHNFFKDVHEAEGSYDYNQRKTQDQIKSGRKYIEKGGKPKPCNSKNDKQLTLHQIFGLDNSLCFGCTRRTQQDNPMRFFNKKEFIPQRLSEEIQQETLFIATNERSELRYYDDGRGIWAPDGIEKHQEITINKLKNKWKSHYTSESEKYIRYSNYVSIERLGGPLDKIVLKNGVYDLERNILTSFNPDLYAITALPIEYQQEADCPKIKKFLSEVVDEENIDKIFEIIGYCLYKSYPIARIFIFTGVGRNGKSVLINLITGFLGQDNVSSVDIQNLTDDSFRSAELFGKLANINGDLPPKPIKDTGLIKKCTGQDPLTVAKKYQQPFQFYNYAKLVFAANQIPRSYDNSDAMHRRLDVIEFPNTFDADDPKTDPDLINKLLTPDELSGLFNESIKALNRVIENGKFTNEGTIEERKIDYIKRSDPVHYFSITYLQQTTDPDYYITKTQLYEYYVFMCRSMNIIPTSSNWFSQGVKRYTPFIEEGYSDKTKVWRGASIKIDALNKLATNDIVGNIVGEPRKNDITSQQKLDLDQSEKNIVGDMGNLPLKTNDTNATNDISSIVSPSEKSYSKPIINNLSNNIVGIVGKGKERGSTLKDKCEHCLECVTHGLTTIEEIANEMEIATEGVTGLLKILESDKAVWYNPLKRRWCLS